MLYAHIPFCERLCPYCSFNRFPFSEKRAVPYFKNLRAELMMVKELGYDFDSLYIGGGTPTIMIDELCDFIDLAKREFSIKEVSCETNPNHLIPSYLDKLQGRVDRLSVGVQSFDNGLLKQMDRYDKYGSGESILESIKVAAPYFKSLNVDMIFNFPAQTEEILRRDLEMVIEGGSGQTTFYPLMASPSVEKSLARTVGKVDYEREQRFYEIISETLAGGANSPYVHGSAWTFNKREDEEPAAKTPGDGQMIDEYIVDYEEYRSGRRPTGLILSSSSMSQKLGWALGGAVTGWLLAAFGYDQSAAVQSGEAIAGVRLMMSWLPAAGCLVAVVAVLFYPLGEKRMERITTELALRRKTNE